MTPDALRIATDILRELGLEDVARWVERPDAVRLLTSAASSDVTLRTNEMRACMDCNNPLWSAHDRDCKVIAAWRALGDPRGQADIERAHEEALESMARVMAERQRGYAWRENAHRTIPTTHLDRINPFDCEHGLSWNTPCPICVARAQAR